MAPSSLTAVVNATMRAIIWAGEPYSVSVVDMRRPTIINSTDAIVRISRAAICGSDLHIYRGTQGGPPEPFGLGHEGIGYIHEIGSGVNSFVVGDPVMVFFNTAEGHVHTGLTTSMYGGYGNGGELSGTQDSRTNGTISLENDYVMLSDIFATGWAALDFAGFTPGDTVAIFGAGPVGLMAAYSALLRGASEVYSVDYVTDRLETARSLGAIPIIFRDSDPVEQIMALESNGVTRSLDAVG